ncbi:MAG: hypothetical protein OEQ39_10905 [Gammaproteobacteria bacterium]|nr:hypothetical protein [Gammaproteobacteria bacterium]MDH3467640.1 hypothetical protein [Gammaproteobacteria bacterium]
MISTSANIFGLAPDRAKIVMRIAALLPAAMKTVCALGARDVLEGGYRTAVVLQAGALHAQARPV